MKKLEDYVRTIPDFPEPGIMFRDVTSVLQDADGFKLAVDSMLKLLDGVSFDVIAGAESRGFIFGAPLAYALGKPFVLIRKKENFLVRRFLNLTNWNTEQPKSKSMPTLSVPAKKLFSSTT
jgi:adenine phosphoribosyltransferase